MILRDRGVRVCDYQDLGFQMANHSWNAKIYYIYFAQQTLTIARIPSAIYFYGQKARATIARLARRYRNSMPPLG